MIQEKLLKRAGVAPDDISRIYTSTIRLVLEYAWHTSLTKGQLGRLEFIQKRMLKTIFPDQSYAQAPTSFGMSTLRQRHDDVYRKFFVDIQSLTHKLNYSCLNQVGSIWPMT